MRIGLIEIALIVIAIAAVVGTQQLPKFGKAAGQAAKAVKDSTKELTDAIKVAEGEINDIREMASEMTAIDISSEDAK